MSSPRLCCALLAVMAASCAFPASQNDLMPMPASIESRDGRLVIDSSFRVALRGSPDLITQRSVVRLISLLASRTGIPLDTRLTIPEEATLIVDCAHAAKVPQSPDDDESYTLDVSATVAKLEAPNSLGVARGIETFAQLVEVGPEDFFIPAVTIRDKPRFPWRGLMVDVTRHFMPVEVILRQIDAMAAVKMNVLHLHLADHQGFRVQSKRFPKLQGMGSDGNYYTQDEIRRIVAYARNLGVRVMPEFDMPGHATSWLVGYPELASGPGPYEIARIFSIVHPAMDPTKEDLYEFLDEFVEEMAELFPDPYFHIGGDEVNGKEWDANPRIQQFIQTRGLKDNEGLQAYFNRRLERILHKHNKIMVGWDEILRPDLPDNVLIHSWRGPESLVEAAQLGYRGLLSHGFYLDHMQPASYHYQVHELTEEIAALSPEQQGLILGGETCMWTEYVTAENIDMRIWPRTAVIAERLWSPAVVSDIASMYRRLQVVSNNLERMGVQHKASHQRMLQRLVGSGPVEPLARLDSVLEPVKLYARSTTRPYTTSTPLNRLVDATPPESETARRLSELVDEALDGNAEARDKVREQLEVLRDNHVDVLPILEQSFLLREIVPLAEYVRDISATGLKALDYLGAEEKAPADWVSLQVQMLATGGARTPPPETSSHCEELLSGYDYPPARIRRTCSQPRYLEELVPAITPAIQRLVEAVSASQ